MSSVTFSGADFLEQEKVPTFGWGTLPSFCGPRHIYGFNGCLVPSPGGTLNQTWPEGIAQVLGGASGRSVAIIANDSDAGKFGIRTFQQASRAPASGSPTPRPRSRRPPSRATGPRT